MSTKPKAVPAKTVPAKKAPAKALPAKPITEATPELNIKVIKTGSCPSLSDTGVLEYEIGKDDSGETYYRIKANNVGGFFSQEWVAWTKIYAGIKVYEKYSRGEQRTEDPNTMPG